MGVKDTHEMRRHLNVYVANEILSKDEVRPSPSNCRFFPKLNDIQSHMYTASIEMVFLKLISKTYQRKLTSGVHQIQKTSSSSVHMERSLLVHPRKREILKKWQPTPFSLSIKPCGSADFYKDMEIICAYWMPHTKPHVMLYHCFSLLSKQMLTTRW